MSENAENTNAPARDELPKIELPSDVTKDSVRRTVWGYIEKNNLASFPRPVFRRIPNFKGADKACDQITNLDPFKSANTVKINPDKPQEQARFITIQHKKTLLVPTPRLRTGLFNKIVPPEEANQEILRTCATSRGVVEYSQPIGLEDKVDIDLVIVGSVAVSKLGYRIGKGEGFADLEYAMMRCMGAVTDKTVVVTCVHDCQVHDLPESLFGEHDVMVDYIVTPTQIIKCNKTRKQPTGIIWSKLAEDKLNRIPVLRKLRLIESKAGKNVALKDEEEVPTQEKMQEDIDAIKEDEGDDKPNYYGRRRRYRTFPRRRRPAPSASSDAEKGDASQQEGDEKVSDGRRRRFRRRYSGRRRVARRSGGEENGDDQDDHGEGDAEDDRRPRRGGRDRDNDRDGDEGGRGGRRPFRRYRRRRGPQRNSENRGSGNESGGEGSGREHAPKKMGSRPPRGAMHSIYVGSLPRNLRVSDFKGHVRGKDVNPIQVIWHGNNGHAFLVFTKPEEADTALKTLDGIVMKEKKLRVEMSRRTASRRSGRGSESKGESDGAADSTEE